MWRTDTVSVIKIAKNKNKYKEKLVILQSIGII